MQYSCSSTSSSCAMAVPKISMKTLLLLFVLAAGDEHLILKPKDKRGPVCCLLLVCWVTGTGTLKFWNLVKLGYTYASKRNHPGICWASTCQLIQVQKTKKTHTYRDWLYRFINYRRTYIRKVCDTVSLWCEGFHYTSIYFWGCLVICRMARVSECWFPGDKRMERQKQQNH